jgi:hypothetical protein
VIQALAFVESACTREPFVAVLNSFFDESGKFKDHKVVSFCGVCATSSALHRFDEEWNGLLRRANLPSLTMKRALEHHRRLSSSIPKQTSSERTEILKPFASCIRDHLELGVAIGVDVQAYSALSPQAKRSIGNSNDPYYLSFMRCLTELASHVQGDDKVSFICDDGEDTALNCYKFYRTIRKLVPEWKERLVSLSFADDQHFPALQAADMLSSLTRLEARRRFYLEGHDYRDLVNHLMANSTPTSIQWKGLYLGNRELQQLSDELDLVRERRTHGMDNPQG